ncbi:MAG: squalene/phytoene synthase family protein [Candidatus Roizmanbacteria bacterium]
MQLINFIRDISEDIELGRTYIPKEDLNLFQLSTIVPKTNQDKKNFIKLVQYEIANYYKIQEKAEKGHIYLPKRYRVPIATATDMYKWTAKQIQKNPFVILEKKSNLQNR